jgi:branched-chain amino acid transport system permease protein
VPAWLGDNLVTVVDGVAFGVLLFTIAVGLSLVFGIMDVLNLAHGALYLAGAYLAVRFVGDGQATLGAFVLAGLAAVAVGAGAGLALLTRPLAGRGHLDQALLTLGVALVVADLLSARFGNDVQSVPPPQFLAGSVAIGGREYPSYRLAVIAAGLAMAVVVYLLVERTRAGALVRATVADAPMVRALGVDTGRLMVATFAAGLVLACLGGVLGAPVLGAYPGLDERVLILGLVVVVLGGLGSVPGAFLGPWSSAWTCSPGSPGWRRSARRHRSGPGPTPPPCWPSTPPPSARSSWWPRPWPGGCWRPRWAGCWSAPEAPTS